MIHDPLLMSSIPNIQHLAFLLLLGFAPSLIWLVYYLRQDLHPEPKKMIVRVFISGFFFTFFAFVAEWAFIKTFFQIDVLCSNCLQLAPNFYHSMNISQVDALSFSVIFGLSAIEEGSKYLAAKSRIINSLDFDEPVDAMIYMIVAALGFAAAENIGYILQNSDNALNIAYWRFLSATFLHTAASAIVGYFFAVSVIKQKHHFFFIMLGLIIASLLHALFNFLIITAEVFQHTAVSLLGLIIVLFCIVAFLFHRIKKMSFDIR